MNATLRLSGLGLRFVLSLFMARFMSFEDIGTFALMIGITGLMPAICGFGLNFFMARDLVGIGRHEAFSLVRDRLLVTLAMAAICMFAIAVIAYTGLIHLPLSPLLAAAIIALELLALDIHIALLARSRSLLANATLMLRSGIWIVPYVAIAFIYPSLRTMDSLGFAWLMGIISSHGVIIGNYYRCNFLHKINFAPPIKFYPRTVGWKSFKIYLNDLGVAGSAYLDRFIITGISGIQAAGIYFFFSSIVNAVYIVLISSSVQIYQPQLRGSYKNGGASALYQAMWPRLKSTLVVSICALLATGPAIWVVVILTRKPELRASFSIVPILLLAYAMRVASDFLNSSLSAAEKDKKYVAYNALTFALSLAMNVTLIPIFDAYGAALSLLISTAIGLLVRSFDIRPVANLTDRKGILH